MQLYSTEIPPGYCACGCGGKTEIARQSSTRKGWVKGEPYRYLPNHKGLPLGDRFWANVEKRGPDECWPWLGYLDHKGYGKIDFQRRHLFAHRLAYFFAHGPIPPGLFVCHSCDNPPCCNARHLWLGTKADNLADMTAKGRRATAKNGRHGMMLHPERHPSRLYPGIRAHGEAVPHAKLTERAVREMRARHAAGESISALARAFGVGHTTATLVIRRKAWRHVT